ncbi:MAG: hypothetical protein NT116_02100, partial [Candidatus Parcubacteria bacterium]|nr:hypothetical protein [Candidatus Parcubacteria bacterium]
IKFYDIEDILVSSKKFERNGLREKEVSELPILGGKKRVKKSKAKKSRREKRKFTRKMRKYN